MTPQPVAKRVECSLCGLDWDKHVKDGAGDVSPLECVRLLKAELATRPTYRGPIPRETPPWRGPYWDYSRPTPIQTPVYPTPPFRVTCAQPAPAVSVTLENTKQGEQ